MRDHVVECGEGPGLLPLEDFDESTFPNDETGSQNTETFAVPGGLVPHIKNQSVTRQRWTATQTAFNNNDRVIAGAPPFAEFAFKGGCRLQLRLRSYVKGRGFGEWLSDMSSTREWRIINYRRCFRTPQR